MVNKMRVVFKQLNPEKFAELIFDMKECLSADELNREDSCFSFDIPEELVKEIILTEYLTDELKEKIIFSIKDFKLIDEIKIEKIQKFWDENVNNIFFREMERFMPGCSVSEYTCYITDKMIGSYFERNSEVVMKFMENKDEAWLSSVVAEEILHLIYWKFWRNLFDKNLTLNERFDIGNDEINGWSISEIIPDYLLIENKIFEQLSWSNIDRSKGYVWIKDLREKLDPLWSNKESFSDFVIKAHLLCDFKK
jgi:uncharacterized protein YggL (DUF469 family)|tara:strand:- start:1963 stop:2718 length:756 start_codon:yes stop_codon:yes gene_type:complete